MQFWKSSQWVASKMDWGIGPNAAPAETTRRNGRSGPVDLLGRWRRIRDLPRLENLEF